MQVYVELAAIENFCMDFTLLYAAKLISRNAASYKRLLCGSVAGACVAVVFPLFNFGAALSVVIKLFSGLLICLVSGKYKSFKGYIAFTGSFLIITALLGGVLIGIFSLTGLEYGEGGGFIISSVPVGIPLFIALLVIIGAKRLAKKLQKGEKNSVICRIYTGESKIEIDGFFDSGNKVYLNGEPVSVIPEYVADKLIDKTRIKDGVKIHTVAGSKTIKVFTADKVEIISGEKQSIFKKVKLGISANKISKAVLHPDLLSQ